MTDNPFAYPFSAPPSAKTTTAPAASSSGTEDFNSLANRAGSSTTNNAQPSTHQASGGFGGKSAGMDDELFRKQQDLERRAQELRMREEELDSRQRSNASNNLNTNAATIRLQKEESRRKALRREPRHKSLTYAELFAKSGKKEEEQDSQFTEKASQPSMKTFEVPVTLFTDNRQRLIDSIKPKVPAYSAILLQGGIEKNRYNTDIHTFLYRQQSFFHWAFGVNESEFCGVIDASSGNTTLFAPRYGSMHKEKHIKEMYAVDEVIFNDTEQTISQKLKGLAVKQVFLLRAENTDSGDVLAEPKFGGRQDFQLNTDLLYKEMVELRVIKTEKEIHVMRCASKIASEAHRAAMRYLKPGMTLEDVEKYCRYELFSEYGSVHFSNTLLDYGHADAPNDKFIKDGDMCIFDMGPEYNCYASDITTSFPSNGKFTEKQKVVYNAVLDANLTVLKEAKVGVRWTDMHILSEKVILEHLKEAGLVVGDIEKAVEARVGAVFMPHGLGHLIGLDVYDCGGEMGDATSRSKFPGLRSLRTTRTLKERMAITIEPGCYFIDSLLDEALADEVRSVFLVKDEINKYRGSGGVRIGDDVIIRAAGNENLSDLPRTVEEIENFMASGEWKGRTI